MSIQDVPVEKIKIEKFIFHVVHHGEEQAGLMDDTPILGFETFFKKRIVEILKGNKFYFNADSLFLEELKKVKDDDTLFVDVSKRMANLFHSHQDNRVKPGVMILIQATIIDKEKFILIKYDHEEVIHYTLKDKKAVLEEIKNTFSKNKDALQKSVIIDLNVDDVYGIVIDKSERQHVTQFFKNYLGIIFYFFP